MKKIVLSENALKVAKSRYFFDENEDWEGLSDRVAKFVSQAEKPELRKEYEDKFKEIIYNMDFIPGGRILRNSGRNKGNLLNCFCLPISDSLEGIGNFYKENLILSGSGGGVGIDFSPLRPKGDPILQKGGFSSGLVSFLEASNAIAETVESGGQRRSALMASVDIDHPEIINFINSKLKDGKLSHYNISVRITNEFLEAVERDDDWEFKFNYKTYGKIKAKILWDLIIENMIKSGEPGLLNLSNLLKNNTYFFAPISNTNPCLTGESLIYVADGRRYVSIKELAEKGDDVPVFSYNEKNKKAEIKMMRHPRLTGYKEKILKITLDDGSSIRCTENHKFYLFNGNVKEANKLKNGDRLHHMMTNISKKGYMCVSQRDSGSFLEHRKIKEFEIGRTLLKEEVVHHKNFNKIDNSFENLEMLSKKDHDELHKDQMIGDNNPMRRFPEKNWLKTQDWSGDKNGRWKGLTQEDVFQKAVVASKIFNRRMTIEEWYDYCRKNDIPISKWSINNYTSFIDFLTNAAIKAEVNIFEDQFDLRIYKRYLKLKEKTDLNIILENNNIFAIKKCEFCGEEFKVRWARREISFCSIQCSNKKIHSSEKYLRNKRKLIDEKQLEVRNKQLKIYIDLKENLDHVPFRKEWEDKCREEKIPFRLRSINEKNVGEFCFHSFQEIKDCAELNYKVISVEEDGYEDVYNGTVDDNHNFYIMNHQTIDKNGKTKYNHILNSQCGEIPLSPYSACCLGSLVLPNFITGTKNTNWKKIEQVVNIAIRFLDNVIDVNNYPIKEIEEKTKEARRIGLGLMGLHTYFMLKEIRYGSEKSLQELERLMRFIRDCSYQASIDIAKEKGSFPKFEPVPFVNSSFVRKLPVSIRMNIKKYGIRNSTTINLPPTGTSSLLCEVTSGVEPLFSKAYRRVDSINERIYIHPLYKKFKENNEPIPDWFVDSYDITPKDHLEIQSTAQRFIDNSISKTILVPHDFTKDQLSELLLEYVKNLKGVTVYRDGCREGQPLNRMSESEVEEYLKNENQNSTQDQSEEDVRCASGKCEI